MKNMTKTIGEVFIGKMNDVLLKEIDSKMHHLIGFVNYGKIYNIGSLDGIIISLSLVKHEKLK